MNKRAPSVNNARGARDRCIADKQGQVVTYCLLFSEGYGMTTAFHGLERQGEVRKIFPMLEHLIGGLLAEKHHVQIKDAF